MRLLVIQFWDGIMGNKLFGKKVNYIRKQRKLTSEKLAELCDVNSGHIRQIESGARFPSFSLLIDLCNALNVSPDYLMAQELHLPSDNSEDIYSAVYEKVKKLPPDQVEMLDCIMDTVIKKNGN